MDIASVETQSNEGWCWSSVPVTVCALSLCTVGALHTQRTYPTFTSRLTWVMTSGTWLGSSASPSQRSQKRSNTTLPTSCGSGEQTTRDSNTQSTCSECLPMYVCTPYSFVLQAHKSLHTLHTPTCMGGGHLHHKVSWVHCNGIYAHLQWNSVICTCVHAFVDFTARMPAYKLHACMHDHCKESQLNRQQCYSSYYSASCNIHH